MKHTYKAYLKETSHTVFFYEGLKYLKTKYLNSTYTSINLVYILIYVCVWVGFGVGCVDIVVHLVLKGCVHYIFTSLSFKSTVEHLGNKEQCF